MPEGFTISGRYVSECRLLLRFAWIGRLVRIGDVVYFVNRVFTADPMTDSASLNPACVVGIRLVRVVGHQVGVRDRRITIVAACAS